MSGLELNVTVEGAFARVGSEVLTCYEGWKKQSLFNGWEGFSVAFCRRYKGSSYLFLLVMAMLRAVAYHMSVHEDLAAFLGLHVRAAHATTYSRIPFSTTCVRKGN